MLKPKVTVRLAGGFEYAPGVYLNQGDEFIPQGLPNDVKIMNSPNLVHTEWVVVDAPKPAPAKQTASKQRKRSRKGGANG